MRIAFPIKENQGLDSQLDEHFGVAKTFLIVDSQTKQIEIKKNQKLATGESSCKTGVFAKEDQVNAVVTKCMGDGSQRNLSDSGIKVYQASEDTISGNLALLEKQELKLFHIFDFCQDKKNKKEGGCGHHH